MGRAAVIAATFVLLIAACGGEEAATTTTYTPTTATTTITSGGEATTTTTGPVTPPVSTTTTEAGPTPTTLPIMTVANGILVFERTDFLGLGDTGLMAVNPDGSDLRVLVSETNAFYDTPAWSPTGSRVAVSKWGPATSGLGPMPGQDIWLMDPNGGNLVNLTESPESSEYNPTWSPDGSKIAFLVSRIDANQSAEIWMISADAVDLIPLTTTADRDEGAPRWSPDGTKVAFTSGPLDAGPWGSDRIEVVNADGTGRIVLAELPAMDLRWSPDGSHIVFCQIMGWVEPEYGEADQVPTYDIWVMDAGGRNRINLTNTPEHDERDPQWATDGSGIAYESQGDIWLMDLSGENKTNLTGTDYPSERGPEWSPDGSQIAYSRDDDPQRPSMDWGLTAIWVMNTDGSDQTQLTSGDYWDHNVAWQPLPPGT